MLILFEKIIHNNYLLLYYSINQYIIEGYIVKQHYYIVHFKEFEDERGKLVPMELNNNCLFDIKRVFYIYNVPDKNVSRGEHANIDTQLMLIATSGSVTVEVRDGDNEGQFILDSPNKGLFLEKGIYKRIYNFSKDAVLLCLSDCYYNPADYV